MSDTDRLILGSPYHGQAFKEQLGSIGLPAPSPEDFSMPSFLTGEQHYEERIITYEREEIYVYRHYLTHPYELLPLFNKLPKIFIPTSKEAGKAKAETKSLINGLRSISPPNYGGYPTIAPLSFIYGDPCRQCGNS